MFDIVSFISTAGLFGITAIIFAECGIFLGFFLPGDSLLFTAGFLASQGTLPLAPLLVLSLIAAVFGEYVGYRIGRSFGPMIFERKKSRFFDPKHVHEAHEFFVAHGAKAIFLARFLPVIRTFVPLVAGVARMPYGPFVTYNFIGGFVWVVGVTLLGYMLGATVPNADKYLYPIILLIIAISFIPTAIEFHKARKKRSH